MNYASKTNLARKVCMHPQHCGLTDAGWVKCVDLAGRLNKTGVRSTDDQSQLIR